MSKVNQSHEDLLIHMQEQLSFLKNSCEIFDAGNISEAKRIAVVLRVLLHDTKNCISLLGQLKLKNIKFFSTTRGVNDANLLTQASLVQIRTGPNGSQYVVPFDDRPPHLLNWMSYYDWWTQNVFLDDKRRKISRKELVLFIADQDGGAHVDPNLDGVYYDLTRQNSITWFDNQNNPLGPNLALLSIRQIAFEFFKTLNYHNIYK
jgi:hypothetical protein